MTDPFPEHSAPSKPPDKDDLQAEFMRYFEECRDGLFRFISLNVRHFHNAEDYYQETFLQAWKYMKPHPNLASFRNWIYTIGLNLIKKKAVKHTEQPMQLEDYQFSMEPHLLDRALLLNPSKQAVTNDDMRLFRALLKDLPDEERTAYTLRYGDELTFREIAEIMGVDPKTARLRVLSAEEKLKKRFHSFIFGGLLASIDTSYLDRLTQSALIKAQELYPNAGMVAMTTSGIAGGWGSAILMSVAMPFLWLMSWFVTGHVYGLSLVQSAPTVAVRQWLVKRFLFCYAFTILVNVHGH